LVENPTCKTVALIGAPIDAGATVPGCSMGPAALRIAGLARQLTDLGHTVIDNGDLKPAWDPDELGPYPNVRNWAEVAAWTRSISAAVFAALGESSCPIILGGDHSLSIGSVNGAARHCASRCKPLFVLWLDAHSDFNTPGTTPSGNLHGMPVAAFCGEPSLSGLYGDEPRVSVPVGQVHQVGIRSIDPQERVLLRARGVDVVDMRIIDENGVVAPLKRIIDRVREADGFLHVSLDVDFLDPTTAPAVGTTVPGGATYREAHLILEMLHDSGLVGSVDVVELNPFLDERGRTALLMCDLVASLFGRQVFDRPTAAGA
jgi:arginase